MLTQCCLIPLCCLTLAAANVRAELSGPPAEVVRESVAVLDKVFWSDAIAIWLDRPGDDLRAHVEGRINPPWWSAANAVETLVDLMDATGTGDHDDALIRMHRINRDPASRIPLA